ncbi:MAG: hypothetical protein JSS65_12205 [Armatimonadetes bacterium]|nr:hypothetical protein [Armatimonadota bacterium]
MDIVDIVLSFIVGRLVSASPRVRRDNDCLIVRSSINSQFFCLGAAAKTLVVEPARRRLAVTYRSFWLYRRTKHVEFDWIREVTFDYNDLGFGGWARRSEDLYTTGLTLQSGEWVELFKFYGEGDFQNDGPLPDWWYWEDHLMTHVVKGDQEGSSFRFVDLLSNLTGAPIGQAPP